MKPNQPLRKKSTKQFKNGYDACPTCSNPKAMSAGLCQKCRFRRPEIQQPSDPAIRHIGLTRGKITVVDADDFVRVSAIRWCAFLDGGGRNFYAGAGVDGKTVYLARFIMNAKPGINIDHRNGDTLDNRKANLRESTKSQNGGNSGLSKNNTSGYKGVYWAEGIHEWCACIGYEGRTVYLGRFGLDILAAAREYNDAAIKYFGEFARLNEIPNH